jgi:hypothetical protein
VDELLATSFGIVRGSVVFPSADVTLERAFNEFEPPVRVSGEPFYAFPSETSLIQESEAFNSEELKTERKVIQISCAQSWFHVSQKYRFNS